MRRAINLAQMTAREVGVNLRGRNVAMAEHLLHRAQIGAALEQMRRKAMAQRVWANPSEARIARGPSLERLEKSLPRHRPPQPRDKDRRARPHRGRFGTPAPATVNRCMRGLFQCRLLPRDEIRLERAPRCTADRHDALLVAL